MHAPPMHDAALIDALNKATSLDPYQLAALVERLMTDPRRIVAIRKDLHLGQAVRFYEARQDRLLHGRIVEVRDASLTVQAIEYCSEWKLPYAAIEPTEPATKAPAAAPPPASVARPTRTDFNRGDQGSARRARWSRYNRCLTARWRPTRPST